MNADEQIELNIEAKLTARADFANGERNNPYTPGTSQYRYYNVEFAMLTERANEGMRS